MAQRLLLVTAVLAPATGFATTLKVAVAANFKAVLEVLLMEFTGSTPIDVQVSSGSTGALYAQIRNGAPYDVFMAADVARPLLLEQANRIIPGSRFTYATGRLVFWVPGAEGVSENRLRQYLHPVAIANPALAPYGRAAMEVLRQLRIASTRREEPLNFRLIQGMNISQTATFVVTGNASAGLVALSQVRQLDAPTASYWLVPGSRHQPIEQQLVVLNHADASHHRLVAFLQSPTATAIIRQAGYDMPIQAKP